MSPITIFYKLCFSSHLHLLFLFLCLIIITLLTMLTIAHISSPVTSKVLKGHLWAQYTDISLQITSLSYNHTLQDVLCFICVRCWLVQWWSGQWTALKRSRASLKFIPFYIQLNDFGQGVHTHTGASIIKQYSLVPVKG